MIEDIKLRWTKCPNCDEDWTYGEGGPVGESTRNARIILYALKMATKLLAGNQIKCSYCKTVFKYEVRKV